MAPGIDCCASSLFCSEVVTGATWDNLGISYGEVDLVDDLYNVVLQGFPVKPEQAISALLEKELRHIPQEDYLEKLETKRVDGGDREKAISWMLKVREFYNFGPLSVALAVNYMDRFLSRYQLPEGMVWRVQLLAVACMSLAAKMEETEVPFLLDLQQVVNSKILFGARTIQRMELVILSTLEWRMSAVTPFSYIDFYFQILGIDNSVLRSLLERVIELITVTLTNIKFLQFRPSVVGAAAALCAIEEIIPVQAEEYKNVLCEFAVDNEDMDGCLESLHQVLLQAAIADRRTPTKRKTAASIPQSPIGVLDAASHLRGSTGGGSTTESPEGSPGTSLAAAAPAHKKRRLEELCEELYSTESL